MLHNGTPTSSPKVDPPVAVNEPWKQVLSFLRESIAVIQDGRFAYVNQAFLSVVEPSREQVQQASFIAFVHPDDQVPIMKHYATLMETGVPLENFEFRTRPPSGRIRWYSLRGERILWEGSYAALCVVQELTEHKGVEARLAHAMEHVPAAVYEIDPVRRRFVRVNDRMCEILGYSREELATLDPYALLLPGSSQEPEARRKQAVQGLDLPPTVQLEIQTKSGAKLWALINSRTIQHADGSSTIFAIAQDITEQRLNEREEKLSALTLLAGGIAHDFNNLLSVILGNATLAKRVVRDTERLALSLSEIEKASLRARALTQQLLTFASGGEPSKKPVDLVATVRECTRLAISRSDISCSVHVEPGLWPVVADEVQLGQVISNLVLNAEQASPPGKAIRVSLRNANVPCTHGGLPEGRYVCISVADQGHGIPADHLRRIFDPYFTTKPSGRGLGLATCRAIVAQHAGYIDVSSDVGRNTEFRVYLPAVVLEPAVASCESERTLVPLARTLFLDDDPSVRALGCDMLRVLGCEALAVGSREEALFACAQSSKQCDPIEVVVIDFNLGSGVFGHDVLREIRSLLPSVRSVVVSGYAQEPVLTHPTQFGFDAAVAKPFSLEQLAQVLTQVMVPCG